MSVAAGDFYAAGNARRQAATLHLNGDRLEIHAEPSGALLASAALAETRIASRLGNTPRTLRLPDGALFETPDNDAIDRMLAARGTDRTTRLYRLESRLRYIVLALAVVVLTVWAGAEFGVPALAKEIAFSLPASTSRIISQGALKFLDRHVFSPSRLDPSTKARLRAEFAPVAAPYRDQYRIHVVFRDGGKIGANAMALPSGTIIFTDQLVKLAKDDRELVAIMAHEVGHVIDRHALRQSIQGSAIGVITLMAFGDVSSISSLAVGLPVMLTKLGYSRAFEREADLHAIDYMRQHHIPRHYFADILRRLEAARPCEARDANGDCDEEGPATGYLSTHPATEARIQLLEGK